MKNRRLAVIAATTVVWIVGGCSDRTRTIGGVVVHRAPPSLQTNDELVRTTSSGVAVVETDRGQGLGFVIDPRGYVLTARHVIEDADRVMSVRFPSQSLQAQFNDVEVVYADAERDLALLKVDSDADLSPLPLANWRSKAGLRITPNDPIVVFRSEQQRLSAYNGAVSDLSVYNDFAGHGAFMGITVDIKEGQSGGPVLDRHGRVIGVVTWTFRDRVGGYAVPIDEVQRMLIDKPALQSVSEHRTRVLDRTRAYLHALADGDVAHARQLTSPSHAKRLRAQSVRRILGSLDNDGQDSLLGFLQALDTLVGKPRKAQITALQSIVARTPSRPFREAMSLGTDVEDAEIISLFFELGHSYLDARSQGNEQEPALNVASRRLHTIEAARTFALADAVHELAGQELEIDRLEVLSIGASPHAVVTLRNDDEHRLLVHMNLEWGDWYVARVEREDSWPNNVSNPRTVL